MYPVLTVMGLMSGTSVDSIDTACIRVQLDANAKALSEFSVIATYTYPFPEALRDSLLSVMQTKNVTLAQICQLNMQMGEVLANAALGCLALIPGQTVDCIASHGQTLYHIPPQNGLGGSTLQIGAPAVIAERTGIPVVADFRPGDMAAGGQGAPLVPFADQLLFQDFQQARAVHNIGGIANLTALPAQSSANQMIMAFDTGPGNMIIDGLTQHLCQQSYDARGAIAASGHLISEMLTDMLSDAYYTLSPPKSTGRERFGQAYVQQLIHTYGSQYPKEDLIATATELTAITMVEAYTQWVLPQISIKEVIVGGGGVYNTTLMNRLKALFNRHEITVKQHENYGVDSKYKEAIAFALLGYARFIGIPGNIPAATGAHHPAILGAIWLPYTTV